jgi:hypothetical protein
MEMLVIVELKSMDGALRNSTFDTNRIRDATVWRNQE